MIIKKKYRGPTLRIAIGITMLVMLLSGIGTAMTAPHEEWSRSYGGNSTEHAYDIQQTPDGGYVFVGSTSSFGAGNGDAWFMKIDAFGNEVINKTFGGERVTYFALLCRFQMVVLLFWAQQDLLEWAQRMFG